MVDKCFDNIGSLAAWSLRGQDGWRMQGTWQSGERQSNKEGVAE
jgi:hypothetical protein